jgi:hypothetical protein
VLILPNGDQQPALDALDAQSTNDAPAIQHQGRRAHGRQKEPTDTFGRQAPVGKEESRSKR